MHKNFLCLKDCSADELNYLLRRAIKLKSRFKAGEVYRPFEGKVLAMLFEKASTRTAFPLRQAWLSSEEPRFT